MYFDNSSALDFNNRVHSCIHQQNCSRNLYLCSFSHFLSSNLYNSLSLLLSSIKFRCRFGKKNSAYPFSASFFFLLKKLHTLDDMQEMSMHSLNLKKPNLALDVTHYSTTKKYVYIRNTGMYHIQY